MSFFHTADLAMSISPMELLEQSLHWGSLSGPPEKLVLKWCAPTAACHPELSILALSTPTQQLTFPPA